MRDNRQTFFACHVRAAGIQCPYGAANGCHGRLGKIPAFLGAKIDLPPNFGAKTYLAPKKNGAKIMFAPNIGGKMNGSRREIARSS